MAVIATGCLARLPPVDGWLGVDSSGRLAPGRRVGLAVSRDDRVAPFVPSDAAAT